MKPIIGIITRDSISDKGHNISYVYDDIISSIIISKGIPIGIPSNNIDLYLNICDGFILQGGSNIEENDLEIIKKLYEKDIPLLGICLGMQEMGYLFNGNICDIDNHSNNLLHEIIIEKDSILYKIFNYKKVTVNTRHNSAITKTDLSISAKSNDGIIEAIEDKNKKFFLGIQWHPENMINNDLFSRKLFAYFVKKCMEK